MYWQRQVGKEEFCIRKTILLTHEFTPFRGGVATYCAEVAAAAHRLGLPLLVVAAGSKSTDDGEDVIRLGGKMSLRWHHVIFLAGLVWRERRRWQGQNVVLASLGMHWIFAVFSWLGLTGKSTQMRPLFHGSEIVRAERSIVWRWLMKKWLQRCPLIFAASEFTRNRLLASPLMSQGVTVRLASCAVKESLRTEAEKLSPPTSPQDNDKLVLLTLARLHPRKGQLDTLHALELLPVKLKRRLIYQIAGSGEASYLEQLQATSRRAGVEVEFLGEVNEAELAETYRRCSIYVMSSRSLARSVEGFGMTYLEAGLFAKPVLGYRTGGVEEAVRQEVTGLLVEEGDVASLSTALQRLIESPDLREKLGAAGRTHALSFSWTQTAQTLLNNEKAEEAFSPIQNPHSKIQNSYK